MMRWLKHFQRDIRGATALEYGLILCLIVIAMIVAINALAGQTVGQWNYVSSQVAAAVGQANS